MAVIEEKSKYLETAEACFNTINHMLIGATSLYMTWFCWTLGNSLITQHVLLCTIGYQFLMAEAIMTMYSENSWTKITTRKTKTLIHIFLQVIGSVMAITGISIEINSKPVAGETHQEHFSTTHGILGLISLIFLILTCLNGIAAFLAPQLKFYVKPVYNKMAHNLTAMIAFVVGMTSLIFGYKSEFFEYFADPIIVKWIKIFTVCTIVLTSIGPLKTWYGQIKGLVRK